MTPWVAAMGLGGASATALAAPRDTEAFFEERIRPLLVEHCLECHGDRAKPAKGGLRLDSAAGLRAGGDSGPVVVPGDPGRSPLIEAVRRQNPDRQMPPKQALPARAVADLEAWVRAGAVFPATNGTAATPTTTAAAPTAHWAFQPLHVDAIPADAGLAPEPTRHLVDRFLQATLARHHLRPAAPADRRLLIRRATFDLLGLPPTPAEVSAFVADPDPDAFGRLVDRLLASPAYGERWARWWLDLARYADTNGQDENKAMANAWRYRDWVVRAFNADLPLDQFALHQLAGDLLPTNGVPEAAVLDRWTATGFLVLGPKMLAEQDKPKLVMDIVDEQIDVVSRAFLGLTVGCARCHDHKFDPIPTRDYYALAGIFKSTRTMENLAFVSKFNERRVATSAQLEAITTHQQAIARTTNALSAAIRQANAAWVEARRHEVGEALAQWARRSSPPAVASTNAAWRDRLAGWMALDPAAHSLSETLRRLAAEPDPTAALLRELDTPTGTASHLAPGRVGAGFVATGTNHLDLPATPALEPARLTLETWVRTTSFPGEGDARRWLLAKNANEWAEGHYALVLDRRRPGAYLNIGGGPDNVFALWSDGPELQADRWHHLACTYDGETLHLFVDGEPRGSRVIHRPRVPGTTALTLGRRPDGYIAFRGQLDEARVLDRALAPTEIRSHFEHPERPVVDGVVARWEFNDLSIAERTAVARAELREALHQPGGPLALPADPRPEYPAGTRAAIAALEAERDRLQALSPPPMAYALAVEDTTPVDLPVHVRGSHLNLAREPVPRGFLRVVPPAGGTPLPKDRSGRLELARWLVHPENPLTARVLVNRVWQAHFGEGLVRTPDNFGLRGDAPTHPELLDWLARHLVTEGWSLKGLHRLLLTSAAWQQASTPSPEALETDPENRWLSHFPRQRLEAEMIRDALLAVSGRLDRQAGGSLVDWKNDEYAPQTDVTARSVRRSLYLPIVRDLVYDVFGIFDFANPSVGVARRVPTVVSHQALFFLNSPLVKSSALALAEELDRSAGANAEARIALAYQHTLNRAPTNREIERARAFLASTPVPQDPAERLATWSAFCQTLLAANEFLYRD